MKIRNGFVSNSSSASFIVHWRMRTMGKEVGIKQALSSVFDACVYSDETKDWSWDDSYFIDGYKKTFEEIMEKTEQNHDGSFTTKFWTSMMNSPSDFGTAATELVMALIVNKDVGEMIDAKAEHDY
jgi:hypothetical protein